MPPTSTPAHAVTSAANPNSSRPGAAEAETASLIGYALQAVTGLATLPEVTAQIVQTVEDPRSNAGSLQRIVSTDPALVTRVLKLVNSAFYGLPGQVASIERAIVMLGLNAIKNVAVAASLGQMFRGVQLCEGFTAKDLWTHCLAVASASRELCKQARLPFADEAFLAGMVHDVGLLIALQVWPEKLRLACDRARLSTIDFAQIEREVIGVDHPQLGYALCEKWKFPANCRAVAGYHHESASHAAVTPIVAVVAVADQLAAAGGFGFNLTRRITQIDDAMRAKAGLTAVAIEATRLRLPELVRAASSLAA
jgi:HD-like signal output (HDOD) protein